jgi:hypothetical protein
MQGLPAKGMGILAPIKRPVQDDFDRSILRTSDLTHGKRPLLVRAVRPSKTLGEMN